MALKINAKLDGVNAKLLDDPAKPARFIPVVGAVVTPCVCVCVCVCMCVYVYVCVATCNAEIFDSKLDKPAHLTPVLGAVVEPLCVSACACVCSVCQWSGCFLQHVMLGSINQVSLPS